MTDKRLVDENLVAVLNQVLDAVYQTKQAAWSASTSPLKPGLQELVSFLIEQSGRLMVAEENIEGRSPSVSSPSSHQRGNLLADSKNDFANALSTLVRRLESIVDDARNRVAHLGGADETTLLIELADGLERRARALTSHP